ncbi:MAG: TIGR02281 family clan AA aspartic protease [Pseudomonadota bacterium]|nr:TIGR02281 family clan AA aspartic protease [Pseudomonadota bacterium]
MRPSLVALGLLALSHAALAQSVSLQGMLGGKGLFIIDGGAPRALGPGQSAGGVRVVSTQGDQAVVLVDGERLTLRVGQTPVSVGGKPDSGSDRVVLTADGSGHFYAEGNINNRPVRFMVDTGASAVAISQAEADRLRLPYREGQPVRVNTANGPVPGWLIKLHSVRVGDVTAYSVDAVVTPADMPAALLGNSFLNRFSMQREGSRMTLVRR